MADEFRQKVERVLKFHHKNAPGAVLGAFMVELGLRKLPERVDKAAVLNAVCETRVCLVDAVQVLTECTVGNKYIRNIGMDYGRYAVTLFDRDTGAGIRVFVDAARLDRQRYPCIHDFYFRNRDYNKKDRKEYNKETIAELYEAGEDILGYEWVKVDLPDKDPMYPTRECAKCREFFVSESPDEKVCRSCRGNSYYHALNPL